METQGILDEVEALVYDKLQVVSYKWLSRNFSVPSNVAKRLLQVFVEKHGSKLQVVYILSGWIKGDIPIYNIRLVCGPKIPEATNGYVGECSVHVYSVQSCIPKDPAALWNTEFVQAEMLFKKPLEVDNCLRDNRFSGIFNSFVKRQTDGKPTSAIVPPRPGIGSGSGSTELNSVTTLQPEQKKAEILIPAGESSGLGVSGESGKPLADKENAPAMHVNKKKKTDNRSSRDGGSLANLWERASAKIKPCSTTLESNKPLQNVMAEAPVCVSDVAESKPNDEDVEDFKFRRFPNGRKRRVVLDYSDEDDDDDIMSLASPDLPSWWGQPNPNQPVKSDLNPDKRIESEAEVKKEKATHEKTHQSSKPVVPEKSKLDKKANQSESVVRKDDSASVQREKSEFSGRASPVKSLEKTDKVGSELPKRRKVLKTQIDERGREVTEVVWEGGEVPAKNVNGDAEKILDKKPITTITDRPPAAAKKTPATDVVGKAGKKKAGSKDPKQGNIMSFFKKA